MITSEQKHQIMLEVRDIDKMGNYKAGKMDEALYVKLPQVCEATPETHAP